MTATLNIHLNTDIVTGDLQIDFDPAEGNVIPVDPGEWSGFTIEGAGLREKLRSAARERLADDAVWESHLGSDRRGERLDVQIGTAVVTADGEIDEITIIHDHPESVNW